MPYDWILFDLDNTLFDFHAAEGASLRAALEEEGILFEPAFHDVYQTINKECWTAYEEGRLSKDRLRTERFARFFAAIGVRLDPTRFGPRYLHFLAQGGPLMDQAEETLDWAQGVSRVGLITNGLKEVQRPRLANSCLNDRFEVIVVSDEIGVAKPNAGFFDYAFREMGQPDPARVLVVGDNLNADIRGGLEYGTSACWMNPSGQSPYLPVKPTYQIRQLAELPTVLQD